ncbi:hypothetical protein G6F63_011457 [Rhizopus arrhizus]|nr:hypothetical protein G6F63_011457 [Rhizopus arrhizus]
MQPLTKDRKNTIELYLCQGFSYKLGLPARSDKGGRPKALTKREQQHLVRAVIADGLENAVQAQQSLEQSLGKSVSVDTVRRALKDAGLVSFVKPKKPSINERNRKRRLQWARQHIVWTHQVCETLKHEGGSIMVWSCISWYGPGYIVNVVKCMTKYVYLEDLQDDLIKSLAWYMEESGKSTNQFIFMQDNDSLNIQLKSYQNGQMSKNFINYDSPPCGIHELWDRIGHTWYQITAEECQTLIKTEINSTEEQSNEVNYQLSFDIRPPSCNDRFVVENVDISNCFYKFQMFVMDLIKSSNLQMESQVHHLLSLSSILLLKKNRNHPDMESFFPSDVLNKVFNQCRLAWKLDDVFPNDIMLNLMQLSWNLSSGSMDRIDASSALMTTAKATTNRLDRKIILSIGQLLHTLPMEAIMEPTNESELITRYLLPAFQALFDDDDCATMIRWTTTQSVDVKKSSSSTNKPDCIISIIKGNYFKYNLGFGEVKSPMEVGNHIAVNKDLFRLGTFCKAANDADNLNACLALHVIGFDVTFYLLEQQADGLYTMTEVCHFTVPSSIEHIPAYLTNCDNVVSTQLAK